MKKAKENIKKKAKNTKAMVHQAFRSHPQLPSPGAGDEGQQVAGPHGPPSVPGLLAAEAQPSAAADVTEEQHLSPEPIEDASRAIASMHTLKSSRVDTVGNMVQSTEDSSTVDALGSLVRHLDVFSELVDAISEIHPYAKMALSIFKAITTVVANQVKRDTALQGLLSTISSIYGYVNRYQDVKELDTERKMLLQKLSLQTVECAYFVRDQAKIEGFYKRAATNALSGSAVDEQITAYKGVFASIEQRLTALGVLETEIRVLGGLSDIKIHVLRSLSDISDSIELLGFTYVRGAGHSSAKACLPGTRTGILDDLSAWVNDPSSPRMRFLVGTAGRGKSAIAHSLAIRFNELRRLGCFFAFDKNFQGDRHPESVLPTIAHELAGWNPDFKRSLASILHEQPSLSHTTDIAAQWKELIIQPTNQITFVGQVLVVIDAFDECSSSSDQSHGSGRRLLLEQLVRGAEALPNNFRILVTSRLESDVKTGLTRYANPSLVDSIYLDRYTIGEDIIKYIRHTIIAKEDSDDELDEDRVKQLADKSEGLFQWAATACMAISTNPAGMMLSERFDDRLGAILHGGPSSLDSLYSGVLQQIFPSGSVAGMTRFRSVTVQILCAAEPISSDTLQSLRSSARIGQKDDVSLVVRYMGALLSGVDNDTSPIRPLHTSFRDFLSDEARSGPWHVDTQEGHSVMLLVSAVTLNCGVRFNIHNIETSYRRNSDIPELRDRITSPALVYAATYLKDHISHPPKEPPTNTVLSTLQELFRKKLLPWLELLSVLGCVNSAPLVLQRVASLFPETGYEDMHAALQDAIRFVQQFAFPISQSAPHVYLSALSFSPKSSIVRRAFISQFPHIPEIAGLSNLWPRLQYVLSDTYLTVVAWSHDGHRIVTGSNRGGISIWHADTGQPVQMFPRVHSERINSIQFSPDDRHIVSGSHDRTVRTWDAATGKAVCAPVDNHSGGVATVAYSPDGRFIASASLDSTVQIRSADTGSTVGVLDRHCPKAGIYSLAFSTDGHRLVVGATDHAVCVWDVVRLELIGEPLRGHSGAVWAISCSPDGRHIVSGSKDQTLRIWDIGNGAGVGAPLCGHSGWVLAVAYSPDGRRIISGSQDCSVRVWDAESKTALRVASHSHVAWTIAYSPDGDRIALLDALDTKVYVWDADMLEADDSPSDTHLSSPVYAAAYSPDGRRIVSCSGDRKICVYDAATGELVGEPFVGHTDTPQSLSYSPDGCHIVSGGGGAMVCIWAADTGELTVVAKATNANRAVRCVAYSPDGQHIIWGGNAGICVYNAEAHEIIEDISLSDLGRDTDTIWTIAYSPDGQRFVSGSEDAALRMWDARTRRPIGKPLEAHSQRIPTVAFSPDGHRIASASDDCDIRIWKADTLEPIGGPLRGHTSGVISVVFSPGGRRIISGSSDLSLRLWDAETGETIGAPFYGHSGTIWSVAWSPDSQFILSSSFDSTMRIWKATSELSEGIDLSSGIQAADESTSSMNQQPLLGFRYPPQELSRQPDINTKYLSLPRWTESRDGWIVDGAGNLLIWVPLEYRPLLSWPRMHMLITGTDRRVSIDFANARYDTEWATCIDDGGRDRS